MKYTRDNIDNELLFTLRTRARDTERAGRKLVQDIDAWLQNRDEKALEIILAKLNADETPRKPL